MVKVDQLYKRRFLYWFGNFHHKVF